MFCCTNGYNAQNLSRNWIFCCLWFARLLCFSTRQIEFIYLQNSVCYTVFHIIKHNILFLIRVFKKYLIKEVGVSFSPAFFASFCMSRILSLDIQEMTGMIESYCSFNKWPSAMKRAEGMNGEVRLPSGKIFETMLSIWKRPFWN